MIDRQKMLEEQLLRENIRKAIHIVQEKHNKNEGYVRTIVQHLIKERTRVVYSHFAITMLNNFIQETVGNPDKPDGDHAFKEAYIDLSSSPEDREVFTEFVLDLASEDFNIMDANKQPKELGKSFVEKGFVEDEIEEEPEEDEIINVSIGDLEDNDGDLSPAEEEEEFALGEDGEIVEIEEEEEEPDSGIKVYSREAYQKIGASLRRYYGKIEKDRMLTKAVEIDGKEFQPDELSERDLFQIYFKKNIVLWAGRYEREFFGTTPETEIDIVSSGEEEEDLLGDELEDDGESINLNL